MLELARHYGEGPVRIGEIARHEDISVKYLEQLIISLKKGGFIKSVRGPKGGHELAVPPGKITIGQIVQVLEGGVYLSDCVADPEQCPHSATCLTRDVWKDATDAMYDKLESVTLLAMLKRGNMRR